MNKIIEIDELKKENKQLKEELETLKDAFDFNLGAIENIRKGKDKLEERIDKAIEYIKEKQEDINNGGNDMSYRQLTHLLEILGDKDGTSNNQSS